MWRFLEEGLARGQFGAKNTDEFRKNARPIYKRHYAEIRELLKDQPDRLLEYRLEDGWEPLCQFLKRPIPNVPFPQVNESALTQRKSQIVLVKGIRNAGVKARNVLLPAALVLTLAAVLWHFME